MLKYEKIFWRSNINNIAGVDEAGRGPLAGPVVAAAVIFPKDIHLPEVNDSKKLSEKKREKQYDEILISAKSIGIGIVHEYEIDKINILQATYKAMKQSIGRLNIQPDILLIDGNKADIKHYKQKNIINGDQKSLTIAAASIIAKVTRDKIMRQYAIIFPNYDFDKHKGYGTKKHLEFIKKYKAVLIHRKSFKPISDYLPNITYYKENNLFHTLGLQIVACKKVRNKYTILKINYQCSDNQKVDIISLKNNIFIFTNIKIRIFNKDSNSIDQSKFNLDKSKIISIMLLLNKELKYDYRLDVAEVVLKKGTKPLVTISKGNIIKEN
tara:strand:- start:3115 stop:4089 length:975 start_codon:yes stop_codon:yes gene_type:complete